MPDPNVPPRPVPPVAGAPITGAPLTGATAPGAEQHRTNVHIDRPGARSGGGGLGTGLLVVAVFVGVAIIAWLVFGTRDTTSPGGSAPAVSIQNNTAPATSAPDPATAPAVDQAPAPATDPAPAADPVPEPVPAAPTTTSP